MQGSFEGGVYGAVTFRLGSDGSGGGGSNPAPMRIRQARHTADLADAQGEQRLVTGIVLHNHTLFPIAREGTRMLAAAPELMLAMFVDE